MALTDVVCHAPLFNVFHNGLTCAGSNQYPQDIPEIPPSFFLSFFTSAGDGAERSRKHKRLLALWEELDGASTYPDDDLVEAGTLADFCRRAQGG